MPFFMPVNRVFTINLLLMFLLFVRHYIFYEIVRSNEWIGINHVNM